MNRYRDPNKAYEITHLAKDHVWYEDGTNGYDTIGTIVMPVEEWKGDNISWNVVKTNKHRFPKLGRTCMALEGMTLRPLTQKEMKCLDLAKPTDQ